MTTFQCPFDNISLDCYSADNAEGAVVVCPGGGYHFLSDREGRPIAQAFNRAGYHAFVLHYSIDPPPLGWAVSAVRSSFYGVSGVQKVTVCGFSAGGISPPVSAFCGIVRICSHPEPIRRNRSRTLLF